jgi:hypothetical protein
MNVQIESVGSEPVVPTCHPYSRESLQDYSSYHAETFFSESGPLFQTTGFFDLMARSG